MQNFYVISGGPGVGKTTVLNELKNRGYKTVPEDARRIIEQQIQINGEGLPWKDKKLFTQLMFNASVETYNTNSLMHKEIVFFDRSILDTVGYSNMIGLKLTHEMLIAVRKYRYNSKAFILPPWFEIYETDDARKQTWEEAIESFERIKKTYLEYDYHLMIVEPDSVVKRADFILASID